MKKIIACLAILLAAALLSGCVTRVPDSETACARLEELGYTLDVTYMDSVNLSGRTCGQTVVVSAEKENEHMLQAYFFQTKEDTETFYQERRVSLWKNVETVRKYGYSIWRGDKDVIDSLMG